MMIPEKGSKRRIVNSCNTALFDSQFNFCVNDYLQTGRIPPWKGYTERIEATGSNPDKNFPKSHKYRFPKEMPRPKHHSSIRLG